MRASKVKEVWDTHQQEFQRDGRVISNAPNSMKRARKYEHEGK